MRIILAAVSITVFLVPTSSIFAQTGAAPTREGKEIKLPEPPKSAPTQQQVCSEVKHPCGVNNSQTCTVKRCE